MRIRALPYVFDASALLCCNMAGQQADQSSQ
jgi:hypothetical protein